MAISVAELELFAHKDYSLWDDKYIDAEIEASITFSGETINGVCNQDLHAINPDLFHSGQKIVAANNMWNSLVDDGYLDPPHKVLIPPDLMLRLKSYIVAPTDNQLDDLITSSSMINTQTTGSII